MKHPISYITHFTLAIATALAAGCIQVKTESEIKPIHITRLLCGNLGQGLG